MNCGGWNKVGVFGREVFKTATAHVGCVKVRKVGAIKVTSSPVSRDLIFMLHFIRLQTRK